MGKNKKMNNVAKGISNKEIKVVADLEFKDKKYFRREDIAHVFKNKKEMINTLYNLAKKRRIIRLNKNKYFLVPVKARIGKWTDEPFIIIDETLDSKDYFIGGWAAANYWRLTDQIPFRYDVYTTRRQGKYKLIGVEIIFHRTTKENIKKRSCVKQINDHSFRILNKKESSKWMKLRE
jgi:predicted transcriptional regulator of viral defense system